MRQSAEELGSTRLGKPGGTLRKTKTKELLSRLVWTFGLLGVEGRALDELLAVRLSPDTDSSVRVLAAAGLREIASHHPETQDRIATHFLESRYEDYLGNINGPPDPRALADSRQWKEPVRARVVAALSELARRRSGRSDEDWRLRMDVISTLGIIRDARAVPSLIATLDDPDWRIAGRAAQALWQIGDRSAVPALLAALDGPDRGGESLVPPEFADDLSFHAQVVGALGHLRDPAAAPTLLRVLDLADGDVAASASLALERVADPSLLPQLIAAFDTHATWQGVRGILGALGKIGGPEALEFIIKVSTDTNPYTRLQAIERLQDLHANAADDPEQQTRIIKAIAARLHDQGRVEIYGVTNQPIGEVAYEILLMFGTPEALAAIEQWEQQENHD
jgi:HEAT repeat protein